MHRIKTAAGFTLVEVLVSVIVVTVISAASWLAVGTLRPTEEATRNRIRAENLLTKSQEEVRRIAQTRFDDLDIQDKNCNFTKGNGCGFVDTSAQFQEFTRNLVVTPEVGTELKRAHIQVTWNERGQPRTLHSVVLLARPPEPVPGSVFGLILDEKTGQPPTSAVSVSITDASTKTLTVTTTAVKFRPDGKSYNYTFADLATGRFVLKPGTYHLTTAVSSTYYAFTWAPDFNLESNEDLERSFSIKRKPDPGSIKGRMFSLSDGGSTVVFPYYINGGVYLYQKGVYTGLSTQGLTTGTFNFPVTFENEQPRCFTLNTANAFRAGFAGGFNCDGFEYQAKGWSSAKAYNGLNCPAPWNGNPTSEASSQKICVEPAQNVTVDIPLVRVPKAIIEGYLYDKTTEQPINATQIYTYWSDGTQFVSDVIVERVGSITGVLGPPGYFKVYVPAVADLFGPGATVSLYALASINNTSCCGQAVLAQVSGTTYVSNLKAGDNVTANVYIDRTPKTTACGNAQGVVTDDKTSLPLSSATVNFTSTPNRITDGAGAYVYQCANADSGFFLTEGGGYNPVVTATNYYTYNSTSPFYVWKGSLSITKDQMNNVTAINLWPRGFGTVSGVLRDNGGTPLSGAIVTLNLGTGGTKTAITLADGSYTIPAVPETWPPLDTSVVGNTGKYKQTVMKHFLSFAATPTYEAATGTPFTLKAGETKQSPDTDIVPAIKSGW